MRRAEIERQRREHELRLRSQSLQRPATMNETVLRPFNVDPPLNDLQRAEELIKREMLTMMHYDAKENPTESQLGVSILNKAKSVDPSKSAQLAAAHKTFLDKRPHESFTEAEVAEADALLKKELEVVKTGMGHGELSIDSYTQVWEECYAQVLFLPGQQRYTRASLASKKDRIESADKKLELNRNHMTRDAKNAAKLEKKLKVLLGGYQSRSQGLVKQMNDFNDQLEAANLEMATFTMLQQHETYAIPKRLEGLTEDVARQEARESELQQRFAQLQMRADDANAAAAAAAAAANARAMEQVRLQQEQARLQQEQMMQQQMQLQLEQQKQMQLRQEQLQHEMQIQQEQQQAQLQQEQQRQQQIQEQQLQQQQQQQQIQEQQLQQQIQEQHLQQQQKIQELQLQQQGSQ